MTAPAFPVTFQRRGRRSVVTAVVGPDGRAVIIKAANRPTWFDHPGSAFFAAASDFFGPGAPNNLIEQEALALGHLDHPCVPRLLHHGSNGGTAFFVCEYHSGSRSDRVALGPEAASTAAGQLLGVLDHLHSRGIVHRDIACPNVLVDETAAITLVDFEVATIDGRGVPGLVGRALYRAPECANGEPGDFRADLYSAGVVLYRLFTGHLPFPDRRTCAHDHANAVPPDPRTLRSDVPARFVGVIGRLLEKRPEDRYGSAAEALAVIEGSSPPTWHPLGHNDESLDAIRGTDPLDEAERELQQERWDEALHWCNVAERAGAPVGPIASVRGRALLRAGEPSRAVHAFGCALEAEAGVMSAQFSAMADAAVPVAPGIALAAALRATEAASREDGPIGNALASVTGQLVVLLAGDPGNEEILQAVAVGCTQLGLGRALENDCAQATAWFRRGREAGQALLQGLSQDSLPAHSELALHLSLCDWACEEDGSADPVEGRLGCALAALQVAGQVTRADQLRADGSGVAQLLGGGGAHTRSPVSGSA